MFGAFLCTSMLVSGLDSLIGFPPVRFISMKPSVDSAHFKVMYGRLSVLNVMKRLISAGIPPLIHLQLLQYRLCAVFDTSAGYQRKRVHAAYHDFGDFLLYNQIGAGRGLPIMGAWFQTYVNG